MMYFDLYFVDLLNEASKASRLCELDCFTNKDQSPKLAVFLHRRFRLVSRRCIGPSGKLGLALLVDVSFLSGFDCRRDTTSLAGGRVASSVDDVAGFG
jgi:hypothetical protein